MGNSEVGHLALGTGRVVYQDLTRINSCIQEGTFFENPVLAPAMEDAAERGAAMHLMGLLSDGGVHGDIGHVEALVEMPPARAQQGLLHAFMDGRDTAPHAGEGFLSIWKGTSGPQVLGAVAHDRRPLLRDGSRQPVGSHQDGLRRPGPRNASQAADSLVAITASYAAGITDEFVEPVIIGEDADSRVHDGDVVVFFNFRPDRTRELTHAFIEPDFQGFDRGGPPPDVRFIGMTEYESSFDIPVAFPDVSPVNTLAQVLSEAGLRQLHIAETEKYAHVTFFFNGGRDEPFPGELRRLIPSPQDVETYDQRPAMSAYRVAEVFGQTFRQRSWISPSSTSPTPTWWRTPVIWRRQSRLSRPWTSAWRACSTS